MRNDFKEEWYLHDGMNNEGNLTPLKDIKEKKELKDQNPIIFFYAKC